MMMIWIFFSFDYSVSLYSGIKSHRTIGAVKEILFLNTLILHSRCVRVYFNLLMVVVYNIQYV